MQTKETVGEMLSVNRRFLRLWHKAGVNLAYIVRPT